MKNKIALLVFVATIFRCIIAWSIDLGNDEVYYLTYAQHLQWNYFDHPPMVALLIRLTTLNLLETSAFFVRLGPIILAAVNTYLIYAITKTIKDQKSGLIAALLYSSSIYSSIIAGVFILPDTPQLFFWMLALYALVQLIHTPKRQNLYLILFGLCAGLSIMSKIHGVFLWFGFGLYVVIYDQKHLSKPAFYMAILTTLVISSPILLWNIDNHFITYTFHSNRVAINQGINSDGFWRELFGGFLYNNPINYFLIIGTLIALSKNKVILAVPYLRILLLQSLPLIGILLVLSLFRNTLPHWSGPGYTALLILAGCYLSDLKKPKITKLVPYASYLIIGMVAIAMAVVLAYPGTLGSKKEAILGKGDVTLDLYNWNEFKTEFEKIHQKNQTSGLTNTSFIINNKWFPGAHIDHYIAQPLNMDFVALGTLADIHTYHWLNQYRKQLKKGDTAYYITVSNSFTDPNLIYATEFKKINAPTIIQQLRGNQPARYLYIYVMQGYKE
ncbi:glycosyltransferase family 39 protein [Flavobacterium crassostreae]|uniref:glycosyltransferase family 39 protein n=1 Tax=Flavobacterium crassostreae TaxID=1763534 RepID=UPI0012FE40A8|nr:glycosyltransferase family 39 protein [Flavobacterium crassostreae]